MNEIKFENFDLWYDKDGDEDERPFMLACRDRECVYERWVLVSFTEEEAKQIYEYLGKFF